jgi:hypothetical protein
VELEYAPVAISEPDVELNGEEFDVDEIPSVWLGGVELVLPELGSFPLVELEGLCWKEEPVAVVVKPFAPEDVTVPDEPLFSLF